MSLVATIHAHDSYVRNRKMIVLEQGFGRKSVFLLTQLLQLTWRGSFRGQWRPLFGTFVLSRAWSGPGLKTRCSQGHSSCPFGSRGWCWPAEPPGPGLWVLARTWVENILFLTFSAHPGQCQSTAREQQCQQGWIPAQAHGSAGREEAGDSRVQARAQGAAEKGQHPSHIRDR